MANCKSVIHCVKKMEKDVDNAFANDPKCQTLSKELEEEENRLKQCIEKLIEASRVALVSQLKEALNEQVALAQAEEACNMQKRLKDEDYVPKPSMTINSSVCMDAKVAQTRRTAAAIAAGGCFLHPAQFK